MKLSFSHLIIFFFTGFSFAQSHKTTCEDGVKKALLDFKKGNFVLKTLGQNIDKDFDPFMIKVAKEKYNIRLSYSDCVQFPNEKCYRKTMDEKVFAKFGSDIEAKIETEALVEFKQSELYRKTIQPKIDTGFVFTIVHVQAKFSENETAMREYIKTNIREIKNSSYWNENISFIVEKDGSLSNITFYKKPKEEVKEEITRIVNLMPKWIPAKYYGETVRFKQNISISSKQEMEMMDEIRAKKTKSTN
ncbi:hypothetical protein ABGT15_07640 [Flavobacterium enshiense]|uniref:hypothetical protein n=1 Tax=Flavobacterium enshiense TaxID=1341165 RepID=UPI00345CFA7D